MKKNISIILILFSINLSAQHPEILISENEVIERGIKELIVTLDSAASGYTLPFDTIKYISFNKETGKTVEEIGYTSDVYYIQNKVEYHYFKDSIEILRIDSSFNGPAFLMDVDTTIVIHLLEEDRLKEVRYFPWSKNNKLDWTRIYEYDSEGKILRETTINEPWKPKMPGVVVTSQSKSVVEYKYDDKGTLMETVNSSQRTDNERRQQKVKYIYEENLKIINSDRQDFEGNMWTSKEVIHFDEKGRKFKEIEYNRNGEIWFVTKYDYYENGLLKSEEAYKKGNEFSYRFVTKYN